MTRIRKITDLLGSRALTVWLIGLFIIYYITVAVWSKEAFGHFVNNLSHNIVFQILYLFFLSNVMVRAGQTLKSAWRLKPVFFFKLPLYAGLFLLLFSFFLSVNVRKNTWILLGEGDVFSLPWDPTPLRVVKIRSALGKDVIRTENSFIFSSEPAVTLLDETGQYHTIGAFPPRLVGSHYMHILNFGIGPGVELREKNTLLVSTAVALRLTPFGAIDKFELPPSPYTFYLSILPNRIIKKGRETARQYDLKKPKYSVEIAKGDRMIKKGETEDTVTFDQNMLMRLTTPYEWVLLDVAYDPFLPLFVIGLLLSAAGLIVYPVSLLPIVSFRRDSSGNPV